MARYYCPLSGDTEDDERGGFDVCCDSPELHVPEPAVHEPSEVGNAFGGYDCTCGRPWLDKFGGCLEAPRKADRSAR